MKKILIFLFAILSLFSNAQRIDVNPGAGLFLPLSGGTLTGGLTGTSATFTGAVTSPTFYGASVANGTANILSNPSTTTGVIQIGNVADTVMTKGIAKNPVPRNSLVTIVIGNSIAAQCQTTGTIINGIQLANALTGGAMRFKTITASTRSDKYGVYGYSGATLATINGDLEAQLYQPLATASVVPELVVGYALLENDITQLATLATMKNTLNTWINYVKNKFPGVTILLCTPRPSFSYSSSVTANYTAMKQYVMSLDNNSDILSCDVGSVYESTVTAGFPEYIDFTGSISGTTLTVSSTTATIKNGTAIFSPATYTTSYGNVRFQLTGTPGGAGTYSMSASNTVASTTIRCSPYTDAGPHPNSNGNLKQARVIAKTLKRISPKFKQPYYAQSVNLLLDGTAAASGTNTSGTKPSNITINPTGSSTYICTAEQPFFKQSITTLSVTGTNALTNLGADVIASTTINPNASIISPFIEIELISGSSNLRDVYLSPKLTDGSGNTFRDYFSYPTNDVDADWLDGDVLTLISPPMTAVTSAFTAMSQGNIYKEAKTSGGTFVYRVRSCGVYIVQ
ncbi:MAG TPA: hypothetical protein ACFYEK_01350 [Candidatus Wunengus sp. YC60]|uniref:hypothetical protein n=1 Tax=Candidatus Wunengus sp. YC60 TaxID=3367697 RepID=UPI0040286E1F